MKPILTLVLALALSGATQAGDVFKTKDAKGQPIYTDRPEQLPAEKLDVVSNTTDVVEVKRRYDEQMQRYAAADAAAASQAPKPAEAKPLTAAERAQRCDEARKRYDSLMASHRLYEQKPGEAERRYLSATETDAARAKAKQLMDESCGQQ